MDELSPDILRRISHREFEERFLGYDTREGVSEMTFADNYKAAELEEAIRRLAQHIGVEIKRDIPFHQAIGHLLLDGADLQSQLTTAQTRIEKLEAAHEEMVDFILKYSDACGGKGGHLYRLAQNWRTLYPTAALREEAE